MKKNESLIESHIPYKNWIVLIIGAVIAITVLAYSDYMMRIEGDGSFAVQPIELDNKTYLRSGN